MSEYNEITAVITTEEPAVAATLDDLRYLVFEGKKGNTGDSAYEEAVALGFVGTEAEWLASLKGEKGDPGADAEGAVRYDEAQSLTAAQKDQARSNIGAGKTYEAQYGTDSADMLIATIVGHTVVWCKHGGKVFFARTYSSSGHVVYFVCPGVSTYFLKVQGTTWSTEIYTPFSLPTNGQRGQALLSDGSGGAEWGEGGGSSDAVLYTEQTLTPAQKAQARENVGAGTYSKPSGGIPKTDLAQAVQTSLGKADTALQTAPVTSVNNKTGAVTLTASDVGALPDDTPIPAAVTEQTVAGWGFTKNTGTYSKPSGGIPKTDLAQAVQTSLGKADTALQSHQDISGKADAADVYTKSEVDQKIVGAKIAVSVDATGVLHVTNATVLPSAESSSFGGGS